MGAGEREGETEREMNQDRLDLLNELINFIRLVHYVRYMRVHCAWRMGY